MTCSSCERRQRTNEEPAVQASFLPAFPGPGLFCLELTRMPLWVSILRGTRKTAEEGGRKSPTEEPSPSWSLILVDSRR